MTEPRSIALVGNPNIGKSSLFNRLTGLRQKVGNFSGVTVEKKMGSFRVGSQLYNLTDLPGTYSLIPKSPDEALVFQHLLGELDGKKPDVILVLLDATNLSRNLLLFSQIADLRTPCLVGLNMLDLATNRGMVVNEEKLEAELGCPVVPINARTGEGVVALKLRLEEAKVPSFQLFNLPEALEQPLGMEQEKTWLYPSWLHWASGTPVKNWKIETVLKEFIQTKLDPKLAQAKETVFRYKKIKPLVAKTVTERQGAGLNRSGFRLDRLALHPLWGYVMMVVVLLVVFESIFKLAQIPMEAIDAGMAWLSNHLDGWLPDGRLKSLLLDGLLAGIQGILIFVPQIAILFTLISFLEESGYMARVMVLLDKLMSKLGLSGRAIVPLVSGVACAVPAIMSTRSMSTSRERTIAIFVTPLMSCSARLPVFTLLISLLISSETYWGPFSLQGLTLFGLYLLGLLGAIVTAWILHLFLPGKSTGPFVLEVPPYQRPHWKNVWMAVYQKSSSFVLEAGKIILAISILLWFMASFGPGNAMETAKTKAQTEAQLAHLNEEETANLVASSQLESSFAGEAGRWIEPVIKPMGFDWKIGVALIASFAAREVFVGTMSTLYATGNDEDAGALKERMRHAVHPETRLPVFTPAVIASLLVFYIFAMQCMSTLAVAYRETRSWKWPALQLVYMTGLAFGLSTLVYQWLQ